MSKGPQPGTGKDQWLQLINEKGWLWTPTLRADAQEAPPCCWHMAQAHRWTAIS